MSAAERKTPGVYITEDNAFPQTVIGVSTAVPAFIGYTEQARVDGKDATLQPIPLSSMADYIRVFGTQFNTVWEIQRYPQSPDNPNVPADFAADGQSYSLVPATGQPQFNLYYSMQLFFANGGGSCYVVSVGSYVKPDGSSNGIDAGQLVAGLESIGNQAGPTLLVVPESICLPTQNDFYTVTSAMQKQCATLGDRVAIYDIYGANTVPQQPAAEVNGALNRVVTDFQANPTFRNMQTTTANGLSFGAAYFPFLRTTVVDPSDINTTNINTANLGAGEHAPALQDILTSFNRQTYPDTPGTSQKQVEVQGYIEQIVQDPSRHDDPKVKSLNGLLTSSLPQYAQMLSVAAAKGGVLPPSAAMAGLYTLNDNNRGVWNAPANMSLQSVTAVTVKLDDAEQGSLNVPLNGMAINAVRDFPGRGSVVWGARTLDGNSQDWRYIQVRRTVIYIEQSIKQALNSYVFAENDSSTWVAVKGMISGFLQGLWSQGGLMGDQASDAFTVNCGVPETMTATDVLSGYMVVQVMLQMVHPAEFIELEFRQTMQAQR